MKYLGKITDNKDLVTKEYVDNAVGNDVNYQNREYYTSRTTKNALYRYQMCLTTSTGQLIPVNSVNNSVATNKTLTTDKFDPFGEIFYWASTSTYSAGANIGNSNLYRQYLADLRYSFNCGGYDTTATLTARQPLYLVCNAENDGTATLYSSPLSQTLPTSDDGLIYIYLGRVYEDTQPYRVVMSIHHPVYWYRNGNVIQYVKEAATVNGHTVAKDVPSDAKFTDTTYSTMTDTEYQAGSSTSSRLITPARLVNAIKYWAVALADKYTRSSTGDLNWSSTTEGDSKVITKSALAFWNGAYSGSASNLAYCNKGAFGTLATKNSLAASDVSALPTNYFIFDTYTKSITVPGTGAYNFTISAITQHSGYTLMGYIPKDGGYTDQWLISYGTYGSNIVAMVYSKYGASLTKNVSVTAIWVKN